MHKEETRSGKNGWDPSRLAIGAVTSLGTCILFLATAAFGMSVGWFKEGLMEQMVVAACVVGAFVGGTVSSGRYTGSKVLIGGISGIFLFLLLYLIGMLAHKDAPALASENILLLFACLCGGASSGILSKRRPKKSRAGELSRKHRKR